MTAKPFLPFATDDPMLSGGLSLLLYTPRADWLKGQVVSVNCKPLHIPSTPRQPLTIVGDIEEMEAHREEIEHNSLLKVAYLGAKLGKGGHPWAPT